MSSVQAELQRRLMEALSPETLEIIDESHLHAGHAGASAGAQHFAVRVTSTRFNGLTRMSQHRLIYAAMADLMPFPIHALRIESVAVEVVKSS